MATVLRSAPAGPEGSEWLFPYSMQEPLGELRRRRIRRGMFFLMVPKEIKIGVLGFAVNWPTFRQSPGTEPETGTSR